MKRITVLATMVALAVPAIADTFGTGANQFEIEFVTISGDANPESGYGVVECDYRIGMYEITVNQWQKAGFNGGYWSGEQPAACISWYQAAQFVNWLNREAGKQEAYNFDGEVFSVWEESVSAGGTNLYRHKDAFYFLPTENEWVKGAYWNGATLQTFATIDDSIPIAGIDTNYDDVINQTWVVGSGSKELNGTFDMMGNVLEFMENPYYTGDYVAYTDRSAGGGYYSSPDNYLLTLSVRSNHVNPDYEADFYGFRVASIPEPATLLLLGVSGLLMRKRKG